MSLVTQQSPEDRVPEAGAAAGVRRFSLVISAMGGQGGGVLADWIVVAAERCGYVAQATSVPGVAQRTGATIYYLEFFPGEAARAAGREPVLSLMPLPGEVDVVLAAELMEAGRAILRNFVDAGRTTLIASTHRDYAIGERSAIGDGIADPAPVFAAAAESARRFICFDMASLAGETGCVISAVLLGALAGARALPFSREAYEQAIRASGIAVAGNLAGFAAGFERAEAGEHAAQTTQGARFRPIEARSEAGRALLARAKRFPATARGIIGEALSRLADYQDVAYAAQYLSRLEEIRVLDDGGPGGDFALTSETARHLALWMTYEDTIRVADLKTRDTRFERVLREVKALPGQPVTITEFMHPRFEELCDTLPAGIGGRLMASARARRWLRGLFARGRRIHTTSIRGYLLLAMTARLRRWRRGTYRYRRESAAIEAWLQRLRELAARDYGLAVEIARCQRLVKGYGETHERGWRNFQAIMQAVEGLASRADAAAIVARLRDAAVADDRGERLQQELISLSLRGEGDPPEK